MTKANHKVLLFVDNCTAHKNAPSLKSIKLQFLAANATSKLIDDLEEGHKSFINVLQGIRMAHKAWESVEKLTIANCFATCGFAERPNIFITENVCLQDSVEWLIPKKNHFTNLPERFDNFVNFDDNITFTGSLTDDDIISSVTKDNGEQENEETEKSKML